jgi:hypothetical protein
MEAMTGTMVPAPPILPAFQQICRGMAAPVARPGEGGTVLDRIVLVQIERRVSLSVLEYSNTHTHMPGSVLVRVCGGVGVNPGMVGAIRRYRRDVEKNRNERHNSGISLTQPPATRWKRVEVLRGYGRNPCPVCWSTPSSRGSRPTSGGAVCATRGGRCSSPGTAGAWCARCDGRERSDRQEHEKPGGFRGCYRRLVQAWNEKKGLGR